MNRSGSELVSHGPQQHVIRPIREDLGPDAPHLTKARIERDDARVNIDHENAVQRQFTLGREHCFLKAPFFSVDECARGVAQVELRHHLVTQHLQRLPLRRCQATSHAVQDGQRPERVPVDRDQRRAGIEPNLRVTRDQRMAREALILRRVSNDQDLRMNNRVIAERAVTRRFSEGQAGRRLEPDPLPIDQ